jgi:hypothetical protein
MQLKKFLSAMLLAALLMTFISCAPHTNDPSTDAVTSDTKTSSALTDVDPQRKLTLYDGADNLFRIVTASAPTDVEKAFAEELAGEIKSTLGKKPETVTDKHSDGSYACEVVVGYTALAESDAAFSSITYGQACVRVEGNRILVAAFSDDGYNELFLHFSRLIFSNKRNNALVLTVSQLEYTLSLDPYLINVPSADGVGLPTIVDCGIKQTLFLYENASKEAYDRYVSKIGAELAVSESSIKESRFSTFDIGAGILNVSFTSSDNALRIIYEHSTRPSELLTPEEGTVSVCEPLLIMRGMSWKDENNETKTNGLCIVIRASNGKFIIIDGGWDRQRDADDLYNILAEYTPSGTTPTVAAWVLTHAHEDHQSVFAFDFPNTYTGRVNVENVIFNPPASGFYIGSNVSGHVSNEKEIFNATSKLGAKLIRPHVGDKYYVGDAVIEINYTIDLHYPEKFDYYNTCSLMMTICIAGQRIMITGDASNVSFGMAADIFGNELKCDIVQVAHHGYGTGVDANKSTNIIRGYTFMSPSLLLWPSSDSGYQSGIQSAYNIALVRLPTVKKILVAGDYDHVVSLPYKSQ